MTFLRRGIAIAVVLALLSPSPSAWAQSAPSLSESLAADAKADYDAGKVAYGDGDFAGALLKFESAFDRSKDARLLWNMAACEKNLRHYARAVKLVRRYQEEGGDKLSAADRSEADDLARALEPFTGRLTIAAPPGATITVDDEPVGTAPLPAPVLVDIGSRKVSAHKPGFRDQSQTVVVSGAAAAVALQLEAEVHEGRLTVNARPDDTIAMDGKVVGTGRWTGAVPTGAHTVRVTAPGMRPYQADVSLADGEVRTVDVTLEADKSGGIPAWAWIAGGVAVGAGIGIGGYFLFKPKDKSQEPINGTLDPGTVAVRRF